MSTMVQPDIQAALGLLGHLNSDELKEMLNDDEKFDAVLKDVKQIKEWETEKEMLIAENRSLAEFNLSREPELKRAREELLERSALGQEVSATVQRKLEEYKSKSAGISADTTHALLQTAAAETEEQSENIASEFLSKEKDLDKFLEEFLPLRKTMHLRKFKADKMADLLRSPGPTYGNGIQNSYGLPYPSYPPPQLQQSVPYPLGPVHMPMPGAYPNHF